MSDEPELRLELGYEIAAAGDIEPPTAASPQPPAESEVGPPELKPVVNFLRALSKAVKAARMYPANNPVYLRALTEAMEKLGLAFQEYSVIRLVVGQVRLYFQGEIVYESDDTEDSLARLLFRDGIREISLHLGLEREELARLLDMVRAALSREATEDLVTQLWDNRLPHVTYTAIDDMLDDDLENNPVPVEFGSDFMNFVDFELDFSEGEEETPAPASRDEALAAAGEMHRRLMETGDRSILEVSPGEEETLQAEVTDEDAASLVARVIDTFFEVLHQDSDPASRGVILAVVENALVSLAAQREFGEAGHILESARTMVERRPDLARAHHDALASLHRTAADPQRLLPIVEVLEKGNAAAAESVERYLGFLNPEAIPSLCDVLGTLESRRGRRVLCNVLAHLGRERLDLLLPYLRDDRWYLVRNILAVLGEMRSPGVVKHIKPLVSHPDLRVRREALTALSLIGQGEALEALLSLLKDADPRMRVSAAGSLARLGRTAVNPLLQVVLAKDFESRPLEEKRGFFQALGRTNATELLPYLGLLLRRKPLLRRQQAEDMRVCAVEALSRMKHPEVKKLLDDASRDPSSVVRAAVAGAQKLQGDEEADDV